VQTTSKKNDQNRWLIQHAYFQPREGARVSLYSDSHHDPGKPCSWHQTALQFEDQ
jgi:hypothetical protein